MTAPYCVLVFYPGEGAFIGLWRPASDPPWQTIDIPAGPQPSKTVIGAIETLFKESGRLGEITHLAAMPGPGSYTQVRVFVATANALAWALGRPLFAIPPKTKLPSDLPQLISSAKINCPLEPVYPHEVG